MWITVSYYLLLAVLQVLILYSNIHKIIMHNYTKVGIACEILLCFAKQFCITRRFMKYFQNKVYKRK